jgi:anti-sigma-K factor RskA
VPRVTLTHTHDDSLAAEYALGTLNADERAQARALLNSNAEFATQVRYWERRLGELNSMVQAVEPPVEIWPKIAAHLDVVAQSGGFVLPSIEEPAAPAEDKANDLLRELQRWRDGAIIASAIAAALAAVVVVSVVAPDLLPTPLRAKPRVVEVVKTQVVNSELPARFVAVLQQGNTSPAFILTVDIEGRSLMVRRVAADAQVGKSYELWLVSDRFPTPRSLGVLGDGEFTVDNKLSAFDSATITGATYAVSLEPEGGSPSGIVTGPTLWTGKLVQALPGARPPSSQSSRSP